MNQKKKTKVMMIKCFFNECYSVLVVLLVSCSSSIVISCLVCFCFAYLIIPLINEIWLQGLREVFLLLFSIFSLIQKMTKKVMIIITYTCCFVSSWMRLHFVWEKLLLVFFFEFFLSFFLLFLVFLVYSCVWMMIWKSVSCEGTYIM